MKLNRKLFSLLEVQSIIPSVILLLSMTLVFGYMAKIITQQFEDLRTQIQATNRASQSLLDLTLIRSQTKEALLLFEATKKLEVLEKINEFRLQRYREVKKLRENVESIEPDLFHLESFFSGGLETQILREEAVAATIRGDKRTAQRRISSYLVLYEINSARLEDLNAFLVLKLSESEKRLGQLIGYFPIFLFMVLFCEIFGAILMVVQYRRRVTVPLQLLQQGIGRVARGNLGEPIVLKSAPAEILEMVRHFNSMTVALESTKKQLDNALQRSERAARVKTDFLSNMSHEIRTPLNVVVGIADLLSLEKFNEKIVEKIRMLSKSSKMLLNIVNDILDFSRLESGKFKISNIPYALPVALREVGEVMSAEAHKKGLAFHLNIDPKLPEYIFGDEMRLEQVLVNLIGNAIKFTSKGLVSLNAFSEFKNDERILILEIKDSGIGISEEKKAGIFRRYEQAESFTSRIYGGTGLGLAIVREIVSLQGGLISFDSKLGVGSVFRVEIPVTMAQSMDSTSQASPSVHYDSTEGIKGPLRILLADDADENRFLIKAFLEGTNVLITPVSNGLEALHARQSASFDLILMDIQMPVMDGRMATQKIREWEIQNGLIRSYIVALTAYSQPDEVEKFMQDGCDCHLAKPVSRSGLIEILNYVQKSKSYVENAAGV